MTGSILGAINLSWTTPGDEGNSGIILLGQYDIFYSTGAYKLIAQAARGRPRLAALLEVVTDARAKRLRLPDVDHIAARVAEQVHARLGRKGLQLGLKRRVLHSV